MANELQLQSKTDWTVYAIIRDFVGQVWNGSSWEAYNTGNLGNYDIPMTEQGTASGFYVADFPATIAAAPHGKPYGITAYRRLGGSPAEGDTVLGVDEIAWKLDEGGVVLADSANHGGATAQIALKQITVTASDNDDAVVLTGAGSAAGIHAVGSGTGPGVLIEGGPTGPGIQIQAGPNAALAGITAIGGWGGGAGIRAKGYGNNSGFEGEGGVSGTDADIDILNTLRDFYDVVTFGAVDDASPTNAAFDTDLAEITDEHYKGAVCVFRTGVLKGQAREVAAYDGTAKRITVSSAYTDAPSDGDEFVLVGLMA